MILEPGQVGPLRKAATLAWLPVILVASYLGPPRIPVSAVAIVGGVLAAAGWTVMALRVTRPSWLAPLGVVVLAAGGAVLVAVAGTFSTPLAFCFVAIGAAAGRLPTPAALALLVAVGAALVVVLPHGTSPVVLVVLVLALVSMLLLGLNRRDLARRAEQRELALAAATRANEEHARAAALTERARIARDVHDVLAHSLSALAVHLQGARLMLLRDGAAPETLAQVERAQRLATEGLTEARRAVAALRGAPAGLADALRALVTDHPGARLEIDGEFDGLDATDRETVLRTAQEALSNVRKHAAGAPAVVRLTHREGSTRLEIRDGPGTPPAPARAGGYGLVGMAERAALIGAEVQAGPMEDGWRVRLTIPR